VAGAIADCLRRLWSLVVLHDTLTGAMAHLDEFIRRRDDGWEIVRGYPPECMPIVEGHVVGEIEEYSGTELEHRRYGRDQI
jgi:hypothetical protein